MESDNIKTVSDNGSARFSRISIALIIGSNAVFYLRKLVFDVDKEKCDLPYAFPALLFDYRPSVIVCVLITLDVWRYGFYPDQWEDGHFIRLPAERPCGIMSL